MLKKICTIFLLLTLIGGCSKENEIKFTDLSSENADLSEYGINDATVLQQIDDKQVNLLFEQKGSALIFFSKPQCPWCLKAMPVFNDVVNNLDDTSHIYYFNVQANDENQHQKILAVLNLFKDYFGTDDQGNVQFYVPTLVVVKNGKPIAHHTSTVQSHKDFNLALNQEQVEELVLIYQQLIDQLK